MLQQKYRFHGRGSLRYVYRQGTTVRSRLFAVRFAHRPHHSESRCSVVVARKVLKSAPKRNRVRRRIYEVLRTHWSHITPGSDIIITVYEPSIVDMPHDELKGAVIHTLRRAKLWQQSPGTESKNQDQTSEY